MSKVDMRYLVPEGRILGEDEKETIELKQMASRARQYISGFTWCPEIRDLYMGMGIAGVIAVFLVRFKQAIQGKDDCLWVVEGDVPNAYIVIDRANNYQDALGVYCELMQEWIDIVRCGGDLGKVFPVSAPATEKYAGMLGRRLDYLRKNILKA